MKVTSWMKILIEAQIWMDPIPSYLELSQKHSPHSMHVARLLLVTMALIIHIFTVGNQIVFLLLVTGLYSWMNYNQ